MLLSSAFLVLQDVQTGTTSRDTDGALPSPALSGAVASSTDSLAPGEATPAAPPKTLLHVPSPDLAGVAQLIKEGQAKRVIFM